MAWGRFCSVAGLAAALLGASVSTGFSAKDAATTTSGLPVPRYVSLKSDHVNVRAGPTKDNDVAWVYTRSGLPVEITAEFENWRRVRDSEGRRRLGLSLAAVRPPHCGRHHEEPRTTSRRSMIVRIQPARWRRACRPASWPRSSVARQAGAASAATASMAGSSSSGCGASTPTRRWIERHLSLPGIAVRKDGVA